MPAHSSRPVLILLACAVMALGEATPGAAQGVGPRVESIGVGLGGQGRVGAWTPVRVDLISEAAWSGRLEVLAADEDGTPVISQQPVTLPAGTLQTFHTEVRPGEIAAEVVVRLRNPNGRLAIPPVRPADLAGSAEPVLDTAGTRLIVFLGDPQGLEREVPALVGGESGLTDAALVVVRLGAAALPPSPRGLDAADTIVLDTADPAVREGLRTRGDTLRAWVRQGGHLVVAAGTGWQETQELLGDILPARLAGSGILNDLGALETFAGSTTNPIAGSSLSVTRVEDAESRGGTILASSSESPLVVRGPVGFGRVTLIPLDVHDGQFAAWKDKPLFWVRALDLRLRREAASATAAPNTTGAFFGRTSSDLAGNLSNQLDQPPGVRLVPFGWVALAIFGYILLIGPIDYLFLKKVLRRMELTWITFPLIVIATSAAAYAAAYAFKGTVLKIVKLDALDVDATSGLVRGSSWMTLFSPDNRDYNLSLEPLGLDRPAGDQEIGAVPQRPRPGADLAVSWFGPPEPRFGGGSADRFNLAGRSYTYGPGTQPQALYGVRIPIWSTKSFTGDWQSSAPAGSILAADLAPLGSDRVDGTLTNLTARPMKRAVLLYGGQVYDDLGDIPPGGSVRITPASRTRPLSGYLEERARRALDGANAPVRADGTVDDLLRTILFRDSMSPRTETPPSPSLRRVDLSAQLAFGRPILMAEIDGPAARLALDAGALAAPSVTQLTILRVILPRPLEQ